MGRPKEILDLNSWGSWKERWEVRLWNRKNQFYSWGVRSSTSLFSIFFINHPRKAQSPNLILNTSLFNKATL